MSEPLQNENPEQVDSLLVSSTSAQLEMASDEPLEEPVNGCDSTTEVNETSPETGQDVTIESTSQDSPPGGAELHISESQDDNNIPNMNRELKSILALSKEAKLDTNLSTHRRKTLDKAKTPLKKTTKVTNFPVTAESELENFDEKNDEKKGAKKRKASLGESGTEGATDDERRSLQNVNDVTMMKKPNKDIFCWRCHHDGVQIACETCPRSYHLKCLKQTITDVEHWPCPECVAILKAENTQTRSKAMKGMSLEHLCSLLKFGVKRMIQCSGSEPFIHDVDEKQFPDYRRYIIQPMTLTMLEKNIKDNAYGSTQAFEADAKWILHNSIIFNSYHSKLTTAAKTIVKICKQEMAEVENCPSCYLNANTKKHTWFVEVCPKPHLLVWAKLKGFPYWPAKVMSINSSGMADVRFFGAHDKAWVSVKDCYLYSVKDPNSGKQKRNDIIECVKELELYVDNLREIYGRVNFAPFKTPLEPDSQMKQLQVFLPNYDGKEVIKRVRDGKGLSAAVSSENLNDSELGRSSESEEENSEDESEDNDGARRKSVEGSGDKHSTVHTEGSMTRIDYHDDSSDAQKLIATPIKTIIIRKRPSTNNSVENTSKIQRTEVPKTVTNQVALDNHLTPVEVSSEAKVKTNQTETDKKSPFPTQSKLKITNQLIRKLEDLDEGEVHKEDESETKTEDVTKEPETPVAEQSQEQATTVEEENIEKPSVDREKEGESKDEEKVTEVTEVVEVTPKTGDVAEGDEKSREKSMEVDVDETNIRNIIHSSLIPPNDDDKKKTGTEVSKKRKHEETKDDSKKGESTLFPPNKMVKLVPIENILQKKNDVVEVNSSSNVKSDQLIFLKEIRVVKDGKEIRNKKTNVHDANESVEVKNEVESDDDNNDVQYMEAKRQYLSALNISEKQKVPNKPKAHEIRTRSKTEEKKTKSDNLTKVIEDVASRSDVVAATTKTNEPVKEIYIKSLSKMQTPKHKARKSFPTPNYNKKTIVARKLISKTGMEDELTIVNAATLQPTGNVMILPKLHYNKPMTINRDMSSPPVLTMLPRVAAESSTSKKIAEGSQNYIPQNEGQSPARSNTGGILLNNLLTSATVNATPTIVDVDSSTTQLDAELGTLKEILPEGVSKGVSEILCQPPPKLKPKPLGLLNSVVESGVPSTAGPVASRINAMAQKLSDYFRGLLVETINDLGKSNNPEATISGLKHEIEELNHKHSIELSEIRRNVSIVLKDIQKSVVEERERIINETKANCEIEMTKKVEEAKSKQWCANCGKEAQFYCCWNTSYCDYPCQQKHWLKHMSKCTQTAGQNQTATPVRPTGQQLVLTPTAAPKFGALFAKPQKVYLKRASTPFKQATGSHITLVESTPGNFELLGSGPIAVNGKILASTSVIEKIKSGNIVTVTAPSTACNTQLSSAMQKVIPVSKSTTSSSDSEH